MKVIEKDSDRTCEVHVKPKRENALTAAEEYGEYVASDGAICCFVGVEPDQQINVTCDFSGTTVHYQYDILVDGVLRFTKPTMLKTAKLTKLSKGDFGKFAFQSGNDTYETEMITQKLPEGVRLVKEPKGGEDTIGTIEVRVSVFRGLDETYIIPLKVKRFDGMRSNWEDALNDSKAPYTTKLVPTLWLQKAGTVKHGTDHLSKSQARDRSKKIKAARPGRGPWAIFRFHYRLHETIKDARLPLSFSPKGEKGKTNTLDLEPVTALKFGVSTSIVSDNSSSRVSTPTPSLEPSPAKPHEYSQGSNLNLLKASQLSQSRFSDSSEKEDSPTLALNSGIRIANPSPKPKPKPKPSSEVSGDDTISLRDESLRKTLTAPMSSDAPPSSNTGVKPANVDHDASALSEEDEKVESKNINTSQHEFGSDSHKADDASASECEAEDSNDDKKTPAELSAKACEESKDRLTLEMSTVRKQGEKPPENEPFSSNAVMTTRAESRFEERLKPDTADPEDLADLAEKLNGVASKTSNVMLRNIETKINSAGVKAKVTDEGAKDTDRVASATPTSGGPLHKSLLADTISSQLTLTKEDSIRKALLGSAAPTPSRSPRPTPLSLTSAISITPAPLTPSKRPRSLHSTLDLFKSDTAVKRQKQSEILQAQIAEKKKNLKEVRKMKEAMRAKKEEMEERKKCEALGKQLEVLDRELLAEMEEWEGDVVESEDEGE